MGLTQAQIQTLIDAARHARPAVCEYWKVTWAPGVVDHYGCEAFHEAPPFLNIGVRIEPRIVPPGQGPSGVAEIFHQFEINPDLRTEQIAVTFDDIPRDPITDRPDRNGVRPITQRFRDYGSGVTVEIFYYYPLIDAHLSVWFGQLRAPNVYGHKILQTVATNGYRSREQLIGKRMRPQECSTPNFGGRLPSLEAVETNLCPYDVHLGGSTGVPGFTDCPRLTTADCSARFGHSRFFGGFDTNVATSVSDPKSGYIATSRGNTSILKEPIRVIFGAKHVSALPLLLWRRELNAKEPDKGWFAGVWEIGEGPVEGIFNLQINSTWIQQMHIQVRHGERGQAGTFYGPGTAAPISNFSNTAHIFARYGWVNPSNVSPQSLNAELDVHGYAKVAVWDADGTSYARVWTDDRIWCLLEVYTNQNFGMGYPSSRHHIPTFYNIAAWGRESITFSHTFPDGETVNYPHRRTSLNVIMEARPVAEQIEDICRTGGIAVPFQHEGLFYTAAFRPAAAAELTDARVFTDAGENKNIVWASGQPSISLSQTPNDQLVNEIVVTYEDSLNWDKERPITIDDPDQKLLAGRSLGNDNLQAVPKRYAAFGVRELPEALKFGYRMLRFGEFDSGGTKNNLRATFITPFEHTLGLRRYQFIKIVSRLLDGFELPGDGQVEYFRVLRLRKIDQHAVEVVAQAYNHTEYLAFETGSGGTGGTGTGIGAGGGGGASDPTFPDPTPTIPNLPDDPAPQPQLPPQNLASVSYDAGNGFMEITLT